MTGMKIVKLKDVKIPPHQYKVPNSEIHKDKIGRPFVVVCRMESLIKPDEKAETITIFVNVLSEDETHSVIESNEITDKDYITIFKQGK